MSRNISFSPALFLIVFGLFAFSTISLKAQNKPEHVLEVERGTVHFISDAPLELIEATSTDIRAVIDTVTGKFAFSIPMASFLGFNSDLQRTHFNENYIESNLFPNATYAGKMIESWKTATETPRAVRTKGKLNVHGKTVERLIPAEITKNDGLWHVRSTFTVPVADHDIRIPRLVNQKIASEINVTIDAWFNAE